MTIHHNVAKNPLEHLGNFYASRIHPCMGSCGNLQLDISTAEIRFTHFRNYAHPSPISRSSSFYLYLQIRHALRHFQIDKMDLMDSILNIYGSPPHLHKGLSSFYLLLSTPQTLKKTKPMLYWEHSLSFPTTVKQWQRAQNLTLKYTCITHWESLQKPVHHWYHNPQKLATIYTDQSPLC